MKTKTDVLLTLLSDLWLLWVVYYHGLGGWESAGLILRQSGTLAWLLLAFIVGLLLFRSDYRWDVPLFLSGWLLGYWGEWWGTTRGVWQYWDGAMPPAYLPPLWGIGLLTTYRLGGLLKERLPKRPGLWLRNSILVFLFVPLPVTLLLSWDRLAVVDWKGVIDIHLIAGILVACSLILLDFDLLQVFVFYICGMLLGGLYETLGTQWGEWRYITGETPPLWIVPLWGFAAVAMVKLASGLKNFVVSGFKKVSR